MRILHAETPQDWQELRGCFTVDYAAEDRVEAAVREIITAVRQRGDEAVCEYTRRFDGLALTPQELAVPQHTWLAAQQQISAAALAALQAAAQNITSFHQHQRETDWEFEREGVRLGERVVPLAAVGLYVPGGRALYPSTVLMLGLPARLAGVRRVVMVTPPRAGGLDPHVLAAAALAGVHEIYQVGGAQAIAALAFGTATIAAVDKIVGPGNSFVTAAKRQVFGQVGIDSLAGPSEIAILADDSANPEWVARDLISQLEHDVEAKAVLVTDARALAERVSRRVAELAGRVARAPIVAEAAQRFGVAFVVRSLAEGIAAINAIAPEHLEIMARAPRAVAAAITNAGAIFLGSHSPVPMGDYAAGPNHTLPTGRSARFGSPLRVADFCKHLSMIEYSAEAFQRDGRAVETLAVIEGLPNHAGAVAARKA
ncbi:MAG: Histidinol dehydrogenase [bacterium]|nr:Histidinol dehydrogenase [bacterium]